MAHGVTRWITHVANVTDSCASRAIRVALGNPATRHRALPYLRRDATDARPREDHMYAQIALRGGLPAFTMFVIEYVPHSEANPRA